MQSSTSWKFSWWSCSTSMKQIKPTDGPTLTEVNGAKLLYHDFECKVSLTTPLELASIGAVRATWGWILQTVCRMFSECNQKCWSWSVNDDESKRHRQYREIYACRLACWSLLFVRCRWGCNDINWDRVAIAALVWSNHRYWCLVCCSWDTRWIAVDLPPAFIAATG